MGNNGLITMPNILSKAQTSRFRALKQGKYRKQEGLFLLEGIRLCEEAFRSDLVIVTVIILKGFDKLSIPENLTVYEANQTQLEQITDSRNPQGIICVAKIPGTSFLPEPSETDLILALDRIADPGNMGTIFRSALWFGIKHILLSPGCVDPYSPKVVRSSMGALGHLLIHQTSDLNQTCDEWMEKGGQLAALHMSGTTLHEVTLRAGGLCLIVGSEAHGVDATLLEKCQTLVIERKGKGESLNAAMATSIALYALQTNGESR